MLQSRLYKKRIQVAEMNRLSESRTAFNVEYGTVSRHSHYHYHYHLFHKKRQYEIKTQLQEVSK